MKCIMEPLYNLVKIYMVGCRGDGGVKGVGAPGGCGVQGVGGWVGAGGVQGW